MTTGVQGGNARRAWWWALFALAIAGAIVFYLLTMPKTVPASELPAHTPNVANGEYIFTAGGCAECHAAPRGPTLPEDAVWRLQRAKHLPRQRDGHRQLEHARLRQCDEARNRTRRRAPLSGVSLHLGPANHLCGSR